MAAEDKYRVSVQGDYVFLETWGELTMDDLEAPATAALQLAEEHGIDKLLDDIRRVEEGQISVPVQAKGVGVLWKLRKFRKVAIVFSGKEIGWLFLSTLEAMHLNTNGRFKGFTNQTDAIVWLKEE